MLTFKETLDKIYELEKTIEEVKARADISIEQKQYVVHCERLLNQYIIEHRKVAKRDGKYSMR